MTAKLLNGALVARENRKIKSLSESLNSLPTVFVQVSLQLSSVKTRHRNFMSEAKSRRAKPSGSIQNTTSFQRKLPPLTCFHSSTALTQATPLTASSSSCLCLHR